MRGLLRKLWPDTLFAQLALIMVTGTVAIQLASSSIWFDVRFAQVLEAPVRLMASRSAALFSADACADNTGVLPSHYRARCLETPPPPSDGPRGHRRIELLLRQALAYELGRAAPVRVIDVQLTDDRGHPVVWRALFGLRSAQAHVRFAAPLADGRWLQIDGDEPQGWSGESTWALVTDYLVRVYAMRIAAVLLVCLLAARLCLRPLQRLADAARALGQDLGRPQLTLEGPVEVRDAARAFNAMQQRLRAMVSEQAHFLAAVSHDLRTPLTRLRLRIERVADLQERARLARNVQAMDRMIGQVLDYLHSAEPPALAVVPLERLLGRVCADLAMPEEPLPITGAAGSVLGNEVLLERCLQNMIVNALRYARNIELLVLTRGQGVRIQVLDRGPGIAAEKLASITEPFVRGEASRNGQTGGYGLGLGIARRIAISHGGSLELENRVGGGLVVSLWLPATLDISS